MVCCGQLSVSVRWSDVGLNTSLLYTCSIGSMLVLRLQTHQQCCFLTLICQPVQAVAPVQNARKEARAAARNKMASAGAGWYDMKAQAITPEVKRDWRLLRLRSAYNPRHFYKVRFSCPYDLHKAIQRTSR